MKLMESQQTVADSCTSGKEGVDIQPMDVLCGRGKNSFNHVGNRKFRDIVAEAIPGYVTASSRATKSEIVTSIVRKVRESGGRFLKRDNDRKTWYVLNYTQSKEKAGHAIRDATITEESKKQRARKRKLMRAAAAASGNTSSRRNSMASVASSVSSTQQAEQPIPEPVYVATNDIQPPAMISVDNEESSYSSSSDEDEPLLLNEFELSEDHIKSLDESASPIECLSSMLMAHFPTSLMPEDTPSSAAFEPLPIDDPFNSYIDQLLGPLTGF